MYELGLLVQTAETVQRGAEENHVDKVAMIMIEIGEASGALPEIFTEYFPTVQGKDPLLADAKLEMRMIPGRELCLECGALYDVMRQEGRCPRCGSTYKKMLSGTEVRICEIEY